LYDTIAVLAISAFLSELYVVDKKQDIDSKKRFGYLPDHPRSPGVALRTGISKQLEQSTTYPAPRVPLS
jgi:hypothetical protein